MVGSRQADTDERDGLDDFADTVATVQRRRGQRIREAQVGNPAGGPVVRAGIVNGAGHRHQPPQSSIGKRNGTIVNNNIRNTRIYIYKL